MIIHPDIAKRVLEVSGDPNEKLCLSPSDAKLIVERSPLHAWCFKRLLGGYTRKGTDATEDGKIYEALIFGMQDAKLAVVDAPDWRTNATKEARARVEASGRLAILAPKYAEYATTAAHIKGALQRAGVFFNGVSQFQAKWVKDDVFCKGYLDHFTRTEGLIQDLKIVEDASPAAVANAMIKYGYDIQEAAYVEGIETIYPELVGRVRFEFLFCEKKAPYASQRYVSSGMMRELGRKKWLYAREIWKGCVAGNVWPSYGAGPLTVECKPWHIQAQEERELGGVTTEESNG